MSIDGQRHPLGDFFTVFATQNPVEHEGTYPLPEAQLDRFLLKVQVGYPSAEEEDVVLSRVSADAGAREMSPAHAAAAVAEAAHRWRRVDRRARHGRRQGARLHPRSDARDARDADDPARRRAARGRALARGLALGGAARRPRRSSRPTTCSACCTRSCAIAWCSRRRSSSTACAPPRSSIASRARCKCRDESTDARARARTALRARCRGAGCALYALLALVLYAIPGAGVLGRHALHRAARLPARVYEARALGRAAPEAARKLDARLLVGTENRGGGAHLQPVGAAPAASRCATTCPARSRSITTSCRRCCAPHARRELSYQRGAQPARPLRVRRAAPARRRAVRARRGDRHDRPPQRARACTRTCAARAATSSRHGSARCTASACARMRRPGGGGEFEQLREYVAGDSYRDLDWKATAKRRRPVTRMLDQEQSQTVIVALDAGRMMATELDALPKLDHAIHAALLLTLRRAAQRRQGRPGRVRARRARLRAAAPRRTRSTGASSRSLTGVESSSTYVDFRRLAEFVRVRLPRRALLVMFSDLLDESQAMPLADSAPLLRQRHLPLCVSMNDPVAEGLALRARRQRRRSLPPRRRRLDPRRTRGDQAAPAQIGRRHPRGQGRRARGRDREPLPRNQEPPRALARAHAALRGCSSRSESSSAHR